MADFLIKEASSSEEIMHISYIYLQILRLTTKMRSSFAEDMFNSSLSAILRDDMLEGFVCKGCIRTNDGVGNGLDKLAGNCDVSFTGFEMEEFSHRSYQKVKKGF